MQVAILVEPPRAARAALLHDLVAQTSLAFKRAGAASRVLVLVPLLRVEARKLAASHGPERDALTARVATELDALLAKPATEAALAGRSARGCRTFELLASADWSAAGSDMLFMWDGRSVLDGGPRPHLTFTATELVATMSRSDRDALCSAYASAFPGPGRSGGYPHSHSATKGKSAGWVSFSAACERVGLTDLDETRLFWPRSGEVQPIFECRLVEVAMAVYDAFFAAAGF